MFKIRDGTDDSECMVIYKITNTEDGKIYVGQTSRSLRQRLRGFRRKANEYFRRAIEKYGEDTFEVDVIDRASTIEELNSKEEFWIAYYNCINPALGYNMHLGGNSKKMHERTRAILAKRCSGWKHSQQAKKLISESQRGPQHHFYGKKLSAAHVQKLREAHRGQVAWNKGTKGHVHSKETKRRMSLAQRGRKITWGKKISKAKEKVSEDQLIAYIKANPRASMRQVMERFHLKSKGPIARHGGMKRLRRRSFR